MVWSCQCNMVCYIEGCTCNNSCYGFGGCKGDAGCYSCYLACYLETCTCNEARYNADSWVVVV